MKKYILIVLNLAICFISCSKLELNTLSFDPQKPCPSSEFLGNLSISKNGKKLFFYNGNEVFVFKNANGDSVELKSTGLKKNPVVVEESLLWSSSFVNFSRRFYIREEWIHNYSPPNNDRRSFFYFYVRIKPFKQDFNDYSYTFYLNYFDKKINDVLDFGGCSSHIVANRDSSSTEYKTGGYTRLIVDTTILGRNFKNVYTEKEKLLNCDDRYYYCIDKGIIAITTKTGEIWVLDKIK